MDVSSAPRACTFLWSACSFGRARLQSILISIQWEQRWQSDSCLSSSKACLTEWPFWIVSCAAMRNVEVLQLKGCERLWKIMKGAKMKKVWTGTRQLNSQEVRDQQFQDQSTGTEDYTENTFVHGNEFSCTSSWPCNCHAYSGASAVHGYLSALPLRAHIPKSKHKPFFKSFWNRKANYETADMYESLIFLTSLL